MKDEQKVFIRGVEGRGDEVIKMLTNLGATEDAGFEGDDPECLYFINHMGFVDYTSTGTEIGQIIMGNYTELHLPEKKQVVDWRWEPKENESYYYIDDDGDIMPDTWDDVDADADRYNFGNCFRTEEEAKVMAEKVKKLLKGE